MEQFTSYKYRKIINLILLLLFLAALTITTIFRNANNITLWEMTLSPSVSGEGKVGAIVYALIYIVIVFASLITIPSILRKNNNNYFGVQALISALMTVMFIMNKITNVLTLPSFVFLVIAVIINICATIYSFLIAKYNYYELYIEMPETITEEEINDENK